MIHRDRGGVPAGWSQAQQHVTSLSSGRLIGGGLWQASRVELAPDQPQRRFAPCGNQCGTPTNSRKQTRGADEDPLRYAAAKPPRYIITDDIFTQRTFTARISPYARLFAQKESCTDIRKRKWWKNSLFSSAFKAWLVKKKKERNGDIMNH